MAADAPRRQGARAHRRPGQAPGQRPRPRAVRQRRDPGAAPRRSPPPASSRAASCGRRCSTRSSRWDDLIRRHAPDAKTRDAILANPLYQNLMGRFVQSHDYIAMERLYDLHARGTYDLIVVDTPPTRNAIDFLEAPARMADFFSSRLLRWLTAPARSRVVNFASKPFYTVADRILGTQFLQDIAEFFLLFQAMYDGFVERAEAVEQVLHDRRTTFVVVSTLEAAPVREAEFFIEELRAAQAPPRRRRAQQGAARRSCSTRRPTTVARRLEDQAAGGRRRTSPTAVGADRGPGGAGAPRGRRQLPELPGRGPAGGRDPGRAGGHARRRGRRALLRHRHLRPRRASSASATRSGADVPAECRSDMAYHSGSARPGEGRCRRPMGLFSTKQARGHRPARVGAGAAAGSPFEFGFPTRCPSCGDRGYLDHIDPFKRDPVRALPGLLRQVGARRGRLRRAER